jgi:hypothetical protein
MLKGKLKITMVFEVPVSESLYPQIQKQNAILRKEMTPRQILDAEEENYLHHVDDYLDTIGEHVTEVSFDFLPTEERWDDCEHSGD